MKFADWQVVTFGGVPNLITLEGAGEAAGPLPLLLAVALVLVSASVLALELPRAIVSAAEEDPDGAGEAVVLASGVEVGEGEEDEEGAGEGADDADELGAEAESLPLDECLSPSPPSSCFATVAVSAPSPNTKAVDRLIGSI